MSHCGTAAIFALAVTLASAANAQAPAQSKYPDFAGQWSRSIGGAQWDPSKPGGLKQDAPLTPEYLAIFEANIAALARGDETYNDHARCIPAGMPRMMIAYEPLEIIITPDVTYVRDYLNEFRRIYTDGRDWPTDVEPSFDGFSIGQWIDEDGDGRYDMLAIETRYLKGPRLFDASGLPLHRDNKTVVKERIRLDRADPDLLADELTTIDNALTRPWTVTRKYVRERNPIWPEYVCTEDNHHITIGKESYWMNSDGVLMPTRRDQPPPDLRYFEPTAK